MVNKRTHCARLCLHVLVLTVASCDYPILLESIDGGGVSSGAVPIDLELLAGDIGGAGTVDGIDASAHFRFPSSVTLDSAGNLYVADQGNHTIRKITSVGAVTTLAGLAGVVGSADGTGVAARFNEPTGVAVDSAGNVYVVDQGNDTIRKITPAGLVTTFAGAPGMAGSVDGTGVTARFDKPIGVAIDIAANIFIAEDNNATIRKITPAGNVTTLAGLAGNHGIDDGIGVAARFENLAGIAVDNTGNVYVVDRTEGSVRKVTATGVVTTLVPSQTLYHPIGVAIDNAGNLYVADSGHHVIQKVTPAGSVTTFGGTIGMYGSADGTSAIARFNFPSGVVVGGNGTVYVGDTSNHMIRMISAAGSVTTLAGTAFLVGSADDTGAAARFNGPTGMAVDAVGNIFIADKYNSTIRRLDLTGAVTTVAGAAGVVGSTDGRGVASRFNAPSSVAVDSIGNVYIADTGNHTIRKATAAGVVTTLAGTAGMAGSVDGTGGDARFNKPAGVAIDSAGNIYVADHDNVTIRKITAAGVVTTLAGTAGMFGSEDGEGSAARFDSPASIAVDSADNIYVADQFNETIRKVSATGVVTTLAGNAGMAGSTNGIGATARFSNPTGVALDSTGNVYITDRNNSTIRKIDTAAITTTLAGTSGKIGIVLGALSGLAFPQSLVIIGDSIVISDANAILMLKHGAQ